MKCQNCSGLKLREAKYNVQKMWTTFRIIDGGEDYDLIGIADNQDPTGEDNQFLCRECYLKLFSPSVRITKVPKRGVQWVNIREA